MPRRQKLDPRMAAKVAASVPVHEARRMLLNRAIQQQSRVQYDARFRRMEIFRREMKRTRWTEELFVQWLAQMAAVGYKDAEGHRAALMHYLAQEGTSCEFLRSREVIKMCQGFALQRKLVHVPIGSITRSMMQQLASWLKKKGYWQAAVLAKSLFLTQARGEELMRMRVGDIQKDGLEALWFVRNDKRCKRSNTFEKNTEKVIPQKVMSLVEILSKDKKVGDLVFQPEEGFSLPGLARRMKEAVEELQWPRDVRYMGPHALRHGGTAPLIERAKQVVAQGLANQSRNTFRHYAKKKK